MPIAIYAMIAVYSGAYLASARVRVAQRNALRRLGNKLNELEQQYEAKLHDEVHRNLDAPPKEDNQ